MPTLIVVVAVSLSACGSDSGSSSGTDGSSAADTADTSGNGSKLIIANVPFPCGLNDFAKSLCAGFSTGEKELPPGYEFELKSGIDFADTTEFNNLIQTSQQVEPGGLIVFPNGPAGQVQVLNEACDKDIKIIIIDNPVDGLGDCQSSYIAADHHQLGIDDANWLLEQQPTTKEVGIVTFPPGQTASNDERVDGFKETIEAAGYDVAAEVTTDLTVDKTRTEVTNMLTAHPDLEAIFAANDQMGDGAAQAIKGTGADLKLLTIDGSEVSVKRIPTGLAVDAAQDPYYAGRESVLNLAKLLEGKEIPAELTEPSELIDETNVQEYLKKGGLR